MAKKLVFLLPLFLAIALGVMPAANADGLSGIISDREKRISPGPSQGIVLVTFREYKGQPNTFCIVDNEIRTQLGKNVLASLKDFGLDKLQVVSTRANARTYALMFHSIGREGDIIH